MMLKPMQCGYLLSLIITSQVTVLSQADATEINNNHNQHIHAKNDVATAGGTLIMHDEIVTQNGLGTLKVGATGDAIPSWDTNGYVMFCPCMGRFGNQMEHLIGGLAFAKTVNRTLILPPIREDLSAYSTFTNWFQLGPLLEFHRVIRGEVFMDNFAKDRWPPGSRKGYCRDYVVNNNKCQLKKGMPHSGFWDYFDIDFDGIVSFDLIDEVDYAVESEVKLLRKQWTNRFPCSEHPVLALYNVPGSFPAIRGNLFIQKYFKWSPTLLAEAGRIKKKLFKGEKYLGIHLRVGEDWSRVCDIAVGKSTMYFASPQCKTSSKGTIFQEMCYPSIDDILQLTMEAVVTFNLKHLYVASDDNPYKEEFTDALSQLNVTVHHYNPMGPQMDVIILGEADFFIGNCISTFTSFIKRERDVRQRLSTFWGYPI